MIYLLAYFQYETSLYQASFENQYENNTAIKAILCKEGAKISSVVKL